jgi:hypothetical protein
MGIQVLKEDLECKVSLNELPEIHQFLDCIWKCPWSVVQDRFMDDDNECPPMGVVVADGFKDVTIIKVL